MSRKYPNSRERILMFINQYTEENGVSPTVREISKGVGLSSLSTVHRHLVVLKKNGFLKTFNSGCPRSLVMTNHVNAPQEDEQHICLKTDKGETIILNMTAEDGKIRFFGDYRFHGERDAIGKIIACSELDDDAYYACMP